VSARGVEGASLSDSLIELLYSLMDLGLRDLPQIAPWLQPRRVVHTTWCPLVVTTRLLFWTPAPPPQNVTQSHLTCVELGMVVSSCINVAAMVLGHNLAHATLMTFATVHANIGRTVAAPSPHVRSGVHSPDPTPSTSPLHCLLCHAVPCCAVLCAAAVPRFRCCVRCWSESGLWCTTGVKARAVT